MNLVVRCLLVILSGELLVEAGVGNPYLAIIAPAPWFLAVLAPDSERRQLPLSRIALLSLIPYTISGIHMWGLLEHGWMIYAMAVAYLPFAGLLFAGLSRPTLTGPRWVSILGLTTAWVLASSSRLIPGFTFPVFIGGFLSDATPFNQLGALAGFWALEGFVGLVSAMVAYTIHDWLQRERQWWRGLLWTLLIVTSVGAFGQVRIATGPDTMIVPWTSEAPALPSDKDFLKIAVVQGSTPNWAHRHAWVLDRLQLAIDVSTGNLVLDAMKSRPWGTPPDWIVLPESAFGDTLPSNSNQALQKINRKLTGQDNWSPDTTIFLVMTQLMERGDPDYPAADRRDTVFALEKRMGQGVFIKDHISKRQLVPIAERKYSPGKPWRPIQTQHGPAGGVICFESLFPTIARAVNKTSSKALLVFTNDSGQKWSHGAKWHARLGKLRAIETGQMLVHASQAGPSFVVDPFGRESKRTDLFERDLIEVAISTDRITTLYSLIGDQIWFGMNFLMWVSLVFFSLRQRGDKTQATNTDL